MSLKKTLLLAIAFLIGLLYVVKIELPKEEKKNKEGVVFPALQKDQIESIDITNKTGTFVLKNLRPKGSNTVEDAETEVSPDWVKNWEFTDLKGAELDQTTLNALLTSILELKLEHTIPPNEVDPDLSNYGLLSPEITLKVSHARGLTELSIGKLNEYLQKRYLKVVNGSESNIGLIGASLHGAASKQKVDLRNHNPITFLDSELSGLLLVTSDSKVRVKAGDDYTWRVVEPGDYTASDSVIAEIGRNLRNMRISEFIDGDLQLSKYGLDKPDISLTLDFKKDLNREPLELIIKKEITNQTGSTTPTVQSVVFIKGKSYLGRLDGDFVSTVNKPLDDIRERQLFKFSPDRVKKLEFSSGVVQLTATKDGDNWKVGDKDGDGVFILETLRNISQLKATAFPTQVTDYGFSNPLIKIILTLSPITESGKDEIRTLIVGQAVKSGKEKKDPKYYAGVDTLTEPFIIDDKSVKQITVREETVVRALSAPTEMPTPAPTAKRSGK